MLALAKTGSAAGAPAGDLMWAGAVGTALSLLVLWVATAHRGGRISWLGRAADATGRALGLPAFSALPTVIAGASLLIADWGFYWDVAKHIVTGRDPGPFGTVAHYPILVGLAGIALAGILAIVLGTDGERDVPTSVRLSRDWHAPLGGVLIFICGGLALAGFPLDDVWHTLFGQDVTLWGPTHILMVGGASLSTLGLWVLLLEGKRVTGGAPPAWVAGAAAQARAGRGVNRLLPRFLHPLANAGFETLPGVLLRASEVAAAGAFLIGLSTLQGEFDYGVPQFQLVYQPTMIAFAAAAGLVAARIKLGRGSALGAAVFCTATFGLLSLWVGPALHLTTLHFPLYLAEAAVVEIVALAFDTRRRPVAFGVAAGALIGTAGVAFEWWWSHVWMPLPWPGSLLGPVAALAPAAAVAGGVIGAFVGVAMRRGSGETDTAGRAVRLPAWALAAAAAVTVAWIAYPLPMDAGAPGTVTASLHAVPARNLGNGDRAVQGTFTLSPRTAANGSQWVQIIDWQGGGLVVDRLRRQAEGVYATTQPIPVGGRWKAILRIANGRALRGVPVYLPDDPAIPAKGVPASAHFTRPFEREKHILQREAVGGPPGLATLAYVLLLAIVGGWLAAIVAGMARMAGAALPSLRRRGGTPGTPVTSGLARGV